jgi:exopolyphosphatase/guanosine-5'-triphosphate,3'-diphosphate pyrophosphatase
LTQPPHQSPPERLAAIDVGSNSIRLVVAEYDRATGLTIIDEIKEQPRLAAGVATSGALDDGAMAQAIKALGRMLDVCQRRNVARIRGVATAAVREATNGREFLDRVKAQLGLDLEIIDGDTEAALSYRSVAHHFRLEDTEALIADIGGGSLELIGAVDGLVEWTDSLPFGAVRMTDLYLDGVPTKDGLKRLRKKVGKKLRKVFAKHDSVYATVIGSGGTFTNLGRMAAARRGISLDEPAHGLSVSTAEVEHLLDRLVAMAPDERAKVPGLNPSRADIIVAGLAVTAELLKRAKSRGLTVSAFGLREGLLLEMAGAETVTASDDPMLLVGEFAERCHVDRGHGEQVRALALMLFDALAESLEAAADERTLLEAAAILHDVGQMVNYKNHQKHSYQLILHADRLNLKAEERLLVAHIARYHRKGGPSKRHVDFALLKPEDQRIVRRMSALLRVADGLDRGGSATVGNIGVSLPPGQVRIDVTPREPGTNLSLECWAAGRKSDVLRKLLAQDINIVQVS